MKNFLPKDQRGVGHVGVVAAIVVVVAVGFVGWWVWQKNDSGNVPKAVQEAIKNAKCDYNDKDLCKFFASWKEQTAYSATSTTKTDGQTVTTLVKTDGKDKSYVKVSGGPIAYETIAIGNIVYTKASDGTWWKQTVAAADINQYKNDDINFNEPIPDAPAGSTVSYKNLGKEKCDEFTCLKYQVVDPGSPKTVTYLWFDDDGYQLRRMQTASEDGTSVTTAFNYDNASITVPKPVKELGANQYLVPGQSEPTTLPATGDNMSEAELQQLLEQY